jgi:hypothetical protein
MTALKKPQISQTCAERGRSVAQIFLSSNFASLRLCVSFFRQSQKLTLGFSKVKLAASCV